MGITAQFGELMNLGESGVEMGEEAASSIPILVHRAGPQGEGESLDMRFEDLFEAGSGLTHEMCEESNPFRLWRAHAYSRQMSCGASWT
jgi:hypothetical protein